MTNDDLEQYEALARQACAEHGLEFGMMVTGVQVISFVSADGETHTYWGANGDRTLPAIVGMLEIAKAMMLANTIVMEGTAE